MRRERDDARKGKGKARKGVSCIYVMPTARIYAILIYWSSRKHMQTIYEASGYTARDLDSKEEREGLLNKPVCITDDAGDDAVATRPWLKSDGGRTGS
jgi:hypothetical protein